jgi:hypothetical protein
LIELFYGYLKSGKMQTCKKIKIILPFLKY